MATVSPSCAHITKQRVCVATQEFAALATSPKGSRKKRTTQEVVQLRRNRSRAVRPKSFVEPPSKFLEQEPVVSETFEVAC